MVNNFEITVGKEYSERDLSTQGFKRKEISSNTKNNVLIYTREGNFLEIFEGEMYSPKEETVFCKDHRVQLIPGITYSKESLHKTGFEKVNGMTDEGNYEFWVDDFENKYIIENIANQNEYYKCFKISESA